MNRIKEFILISVFIFLFFCASICAQQKIKLWDDALTNKQKWSELTVFLPEKPDTSGISVIICPGGSYYWLDMNNEGYSVAKYLNNNGITAFVLRYRTARRGNHHPAMIQDLQRSLQVVKENAIIYKINPEKIGVMGFSAGGHLAGMAAEYFDTNFIGRDEESSTLIKPYFAAMIYPVISMEDSICHKKSRKNLLGENYSREMAKMMSLELNVRPDMPQMFFLHCTNDKTVDYRNSLVFSQALTKNDVPYKFLLLNENGHGFGIKQNGKATGWINEFIKWISTVNSKSK
ncbi:MAG: alpha/beta hydrolase [Prevotellaceae bacterium]|jgi:acetyl esterase/lipase|nr:alpha/beta hydrolase [Prevotellaceae bacterium]